MRGKTDTQPEPKSYVPKTGDFVEFEWSNQKDKGIVFNHNGVTKICNNHYKSSLSHLRLGSAEKVVKIGDTCVTGQYAFEAVKTVLKRKLNQE